MSRSPFLIIKGRGFNAQDFVQFRRSCRVLQKHTLFWEDIVAGSESGQGAFMKTR